MVPEAGMRIVKLLIRETGTYNPQHRRPFHTELSGQTMANIQERLDPQAPYQPELLAGLAGSFLKPSAQSEGVIEIPNGWNERRGRFMMLVEYRYQTGNTAMEIVQGYTEYLGISHTGAVDPQMNFIVNSTTKVRTIQERTPHGIFTHQTATNSCHVLADNNFSGIDTPNRGHQMRPEDVFAVMSRSHVPDLGQAFDMRTALTQRPTMSSRSNATPANYMARILESHKNASRSSEYGIGAAEIFSAARGTVAEPLTSHDKFLSAASQVQGTGILSNHFTFGTLQRLDPGVDNVTAVVLSGPTQQGGLAQVGQGEGWQGADRETQIATILSQSVPGLLMDLLLTRVAFRSTNQLPGSQIQTLIGDAENFARDDPTEALQRFVSRLDLHVLRDISYDNQVGFHLEMEIDLLGDTVIRMQYDGGAWVNYVTPSFCDALLTPVITYNANLSAGMANHFETLIGGLAEVGVSGHPGNVAPIFGKL